MRTRRARRIGFNVLALLVFVVMVFPVYWMVSTAFKPAQRDLRQHTVWFPYHPTLGNLQRDPPAALLGRRQEP
jgi:N,N'-diacetylchitobiose transport system permease protein